MCAWFHAKLLQYCPTLCNCLCNPRHCSLVGSSVHGILQARIVEWVAMLSSRGSSRLRSWTSLSCSSCIAGRFFTTEPRGMPKVIYVHCASLLRCVWLFATPKTAACHMGILQARVLECVALPSSRDFSQHRDEPRSLTLHVESLLSEPPGNIYLYKLCYIT